MGPDHGFPYAEPASTPGGAQLRGLREQVSNESLYVITVAGLKPRQ